MLKSPSFENLGNINAKECEPIEYWNQIISNFSENINLNDKKRYVLITAFPFEKMKENKFEKRQGSDLSAFVFNKNIKNDYLTVNGLEQYEFISFLEYYESHPLKIMTSKENLKEFYDKQYFVELKKHFKIFEKNSQINLLFIGNYFGLENNLSQFFELHEKNLNKGVLLSLSPLVNNSFKEKWDQRFEFINLGLDSRFYVESDKTKSINILRSDSIKKEIETIEEISKKLDKKDLENVFLLIDCEVFASDYFPGLSQFFPFSYNKNEIRLLNKKLKNLMNSTVSVIITNYNPTVEEYRSFSFLSNFIHDLFKTE